MITSKLTRRAQTTIPRAVRIALGLLAGDRIAYAIGGGRVVLTRFDACHVPGDPFATFSEWSSATDAEAYRNL